MTAGSAKREGLSVIVHAVQNGVAKRERCGDIADGRLPDPSAVGEPERGHAPSSALRRDEHATTARDRGGCKGAVSPPPPERCTAPGIDRIHPSVGGGDERYA